MRTKWALSLIFFVALFLISTTRHELTFASLSTMTSPLKQGSRGTSVNEVQERLKFLGYFPSDVTTTYYYGPVTTKAVTWFQTNFGLPKKDGIVDNKTWEMLMRATSKYKSKDEVKQNPGKDDSNKIITQEKTKGTEKVNIPQSSCGFSHNEIVQLEKVAYAEARGEGHEGMVAVTSVILNRIKTPGFPNNISGVIFEPRAFESVANGAYYRAKPDDSTKKAVQSAINGWDPSNGCIYFFNPAGVKNKWVWNNLTVVKKIGKHVFCRKK